MPTDTSVPSINEYCASLERLEPTDFKNTDIKFVPSVQGQIEGEVRSTRGGHDCPLPEKVALWWERYAKENPDWVKRNPIVKKFLAFRGIVVPGYEPTKTQKICARVFNSDHTEVSRDNLYMGKKKKLGWNYGEFKYREGEGSNEVVCPLPNNVIHWWTSLWNQPKHKEQAKSYPALLAGLKFHRAVVPIRKRIRSIGDKIFRDKQVMPDHRELASNNKGKDSHDSGNKTEEKEVLKKVPKEEEPSSQQSEKKRPVLEESNGERFLALESDFEKASKLSVSDLPTETQSSPAQCSYRMRNGSRHFDSERVAVFYSEKDLEESGKVGFATLVKERATEKKIKENASSQPLRMSSKENHKPLHYEYKRNILGLTVGSSAELKSNGDEIISKEVFSLYGRVSYVRYCRFKKPSFKEQEKKPLQEIPQEDPQSTASDAEAKRKVSEGIAGLGFGLQKDLVSENPEENVMTSPLSVSGALGVSLQGAGGKTLTEMLSTLGVSQAGKGAPKDRSLFNQGFKLLSESLKDSGEGVELNQALNIYPDKRSKLKDIFKSRIKGTFNTDPKSLDYKEDLSGAVRKINQDVSDATKGMIKQLVTERSLEDLKNSGGQVATSAVHFKGQWRFRFDPRKTKTDQFTKANGEKVSVKMMEHSVDRGKRGPELGYLISKDFKMASLPYTGDKFYMDVIIPERGKMGEVQSRLASSNYQKDFVEELEDSDNLSVKLPKFKLEFTAGNLHKSLKKKMPTAFSDNADFSAMGDTDSKISKVIHKVIMEVDEEGTEAAAATAVKLLFKGIGPKSPPPIVADKPFIVVIRHKETGMPVFSATIQDPTKKLSKAR